MLADRNPATRYETRSGCRLGRLIDSMDTDDQVTIGAWLYHRPDLSNRVIAEELNDEYPGAQVSGQTVQRHRAHTCSCPREA